ncbi:MAG: hypothetical protein JWM41_259 [Gemmatimonadetes bacterium]|nr:hypothetical protein [Gemmatimonadota bacterium]
MPASVSRPEQVRSLAALIRTLDLPKSTERWSCASLGSAHVGAVLADATLQSGVNYNAIVAPRVKRIISDCPQASVTSGLRSVLRASGPQAFLNIANLRKCATIWGLADLLRDEGVETIHELATWVIRPDAIDKLRAVFGVGPKTASFMRLQLGHDAIAIDRHIWGAAESAGVQEPDPDRLAALFKDAIAGTEITLAQVDEALWLRGSRNQ